MLRAVAALDKLEKGEKDEDRAIGIRIVKRALEEPLRQIANNAGFEGSVVVKQVKDLEQDKGFDAQDEKFVDMVDSGIIDPTKVVRSALQNAVSIAGLMLTTEALVSEIPEKKKDMAQMAGGMGEDY